MNPPTQPPADQPPPQDNMPFKTDVVQNIPMQTQAPDHLSKDNNDVELDLMMQDVGQALKKNVRRPIKHHFFSKKPKAAPIALPSSPPQPTPEPAAHSTNPQTQLQSQNQPQQVSQAPATPKPKHSMPVFVILVTLIITAALVVVAVATYNQK